MFKRREKIDTRSNPLAVLSLQLTSSSRRRFLLKFATFRTVCISFFFTIPLPYVEYNNNNNNNRTTVFAVTREHGEQRTRRNHTDGRTSPSTTVYVKTNSTEL